MTEASDTLRNKRVVVLAGGSGRVTTTYGMAWSRRSGRSPWWARAPRWGTAGPMTPLHRTALRSIDVGRGLVWEHVVGFRRFVRRFQADLVHVNRELWAVASQEILSCGTRVVVHGAENLWQHGGRAEQMIRNRLVERAVRHIHGYASWNHDGAQHVSALRQKIGLAPIPTMVLPAIVPAGQYRHARWNPSEDGPLRVLLVGRATYEKGFQSVIDAAADLGDVRITLCGAGEALDELTDRATASGVEFDAIGWVSPAQVVEEMAKSHVLVQPSRTTPVWTEQFGRSVAEAMTVGLPCVVSSSGELPHLVQHDARAVFAEGDAEDLGRRLGALTEPAARRALSDHQHALADAWRPDRAGAELAGLWSRVLT